MSSLVVAAIIFAAAFGGSMLGILLQRVLPEAHLKMESREVIKLSTGLVATMVALVLGLLIGAAQTSFDSQSDGFQQMAANVILVDHSLARFGSEGKYAREALRRVVEATIGAIWPTNGAARDGIGNASITKDGESFYGAVCSLEPRDEAQRHARDAAIKIAIELGRARWLLNQESAETLPRPFLVVLALWLFVLFGSFGLFSPSENPTVVAVLFVCSLSVAAAAFLVVDLDRPFDGLIQVSSEPLRDALTQMGR